jgi:peptidoglycan LD-endopeptidase LytH
MKPFKLICLLFLCMSCNGTRLDKVFKTASPYEQYVRDVSGSSLKESGLVQDYIQAGERVLGDSTTVELPYQELGYFDPVKPQAMALRFPVREGQQIEIRFVPVSQPEARFFLDLYEIRPDGSLNRKASADASLSLTEKIGRTGFNVLRIQPEMLRGGVFELQITYSGSLAFPIPEKTSRNIASFYGDARDGGRRRHEGIDVFVPRGTPVVAVLDGRVSRVGTNRLGGKTVNVTGGGYSYYYAHLDSQLVQLGKQVKKGDTLGLAGNSGNAITTSPHLHFGIYSMGRGSVDPLFFFRNAEPLAKLKLADSSGVGQLVRVKGKSVNFRAAPSTNSLALGKLQGNTVMTVEGKSGSWLRVRLPQFQQGYIAESLVEAAIPVRSIAVDQNDFYKESWHQKVYSQELETGEARVLGSYETFNLIQTEDGRILWHQPRE